MCISLIYDWKLATCFNHVAPGYKAENAIGTSLTKQYDPILHGELYGDFIDIRRTIDYSWHTNYSKARQLWQDQVVKNIAPCRDAKQTWPWLVLTAGAMGAGMSYEYK